MVLPPVGKGTKFASRTITPVRMKITRSSSMLMACLLSYTSIMAQEKIKQTAGRSQLGIFAPKFAELNDDVLFGGVWSRTDKLSLRDRSLVTITAILSHGITDPSLAYHLRTARANGITRTEISEIITHVAFYAGWPKAWAAFRYAKEVWADDYGAQNEAYNVERGRKTPKAVYLQRVARVEAMRSAQNEMFT